MDLNQIVIDKDEAAERAAEYGTAEDQTAEDKEIAAGYRAAAKGRPLIRLSQVIASGGFFDNGLPRLAVIRADGALQCFAWWNSWNGGDVIFADQAGQSVNRGALVGRHSVRVPVPADARPQNAGRRSGGTLVPVVPPRHRVRWPRMPAFHILWEVESWDMVPPEDPALIRHIGGDLWEVRATWNLSDLERAVLAQRAS
jgi:hypothetical protein